MSDGEELDDRGRSATVRVSGPGAHRVRSAVGIIRALAAQPPPSESFTATLPVRQVPGRGAPHAEPALLVSAPHMRAPDETTAPSAAQTLHVVEAARRQLETALVGASEGSPDGLRHARDSTREAVSRVAAALAATADGPEAGEDKDEDDEQAAADALLIARADALLGTPALPTGLLGDGALVPGNAFHDFAEYHFVRDPWSAIAIGTGPPIIPPAPLERFLARAREIIEAAVWGYCWREHDLGAYWTVDFTPHFPGFIDTIYKHFLAWVAEPLYELQASLLVHYDGSSGDPMEDVLSAFDLWVVQLCKTTGWSDASVTSAFDSPQRWLTAADEIMARFDQLFPDAEPSQFLPDEDREEYTFTPYPAVANFGLRVVWRQEWRPLGNQPGEIVRTIPLGPKQVEKVSVKAVMTRKEARSVDELTSTETTTESSTTTKDSSDVVREASSNFKWHADAEVSGSYAMVSAKLSAGAGGEQASSSKDTKARLNETVAKTASRMKRDIKVVVSTETTVTEESARTSEITNPNDEIALTFVYSKLQRAYELTTRLAEVNSVVYVSEPLPTPAAITSSWVQRNAGPIRRALLDSAHASELAAIVDEPDELDLPDDGGVFKAAADAGTSAADGYQNFQGGYLPDFLASGQETFARALEARRAETAERQRRRHRRSGLIAHIRTHILHYMRAIWSDEDADQRWLRYSRRLVPTRWVFVPDGQPKPGFPINGRFVPDYTSESLRPLTEVINPAGPIGYAGNYAVYLLRGTPRLANMHEALASLRANYAHFDVAVTVPQHLTLLDAVAHEPRHPFASYRLTRQGGVWTGAVTAVGTTTAAIPINVTEVGGGLDFDGLRVWVDGAAIDGDVLDIDLTITGELADPELRSLKLSDPLPPPAREPGFFSDAVLREMAAFVPAVADAVKPGDGWDDLDAEAQAVVRGNYHRFVMVRGATRRTVLDTNNVVVDLEVGGTPALEEFKRLHRYLDVVKEVEERQRRRLENLRRRARIDQGALSDPDIERLTVVASQAALGDLIGNGADDGPPPQ